MVAFITRWPKIKDCGLQEVGYDIIRFRIFGFEFCIIKWKKINVHKKT